MPDAALDSEIQSLLAQRAALAAEDVAQSLAGLLGTIGVQEQAAQLFQDEAVAATAQDSLEASARSLASIVQVGYKALVELVDRGNLSLSTDLTVSLPAKASNPIELEKPSQPSPPSENPKNGYRPESSLRRNLSYTPEQLATSFVDQEDIVNPPVQDPSKIVEVELLDERGVLEVRIDGQTVPANRDVAFILNILLLHRTPLARSDFFDYGFRPGSPSTQARGSAFLSARQRLNAMFPTYELLETTGRQGGAKYKLYDHVQAKSLTSPNGSVLKKN